MGPPYTQYCCFHGLISRQFTLPSLAYHTENDPKGKFSSILYTERGLPLKPTWCWVIFNHGAIFMVALTPKIIL